MNDIEQRELEKLQERIEYERIVLARSQKRDGERIEPVAVRINGGQLCYGELKVIEPEFGIDAFANAQPYVRMPGEWRVEIRVSYATALEAVDLLGQNQVEVTMGDVHSQPLSGTGFAYLPPLIAVTSLDWLMRIQGIGELRGTLDTPNS